MHLYNKSFHQDDFASLDNKEDFIYSEVYIVLFGDLPNKEEYLNNGGSSKEWKHQEKLYSEKSYNPFFDIYNQLNS
jgi:hypothetical protein